MAMKPAGSKAQVLRETHQEAYFYFIFTMFLSRFKVCSEPPLPRIKKKKMQGRLRVVSKWYLDAQGGGMIRWIHLDTYLSNAILINLEV